MVSLKLFEIYELFPRHRDQDRAASVVGDPRRRRPDIGKEHASCSVIEAGRDRIAMSLREGSRLRGLGTRVEGE